MNEKYKRFHHLNTLSDLPSSGIEKYIQDQHKKYNQSIVDVAKRCRAVSPERAGVEYIMGIQNIKSKYDELLSRTDFKLMVSYKLLETRRRLENLKNQKENRLRKIWKLEHRIQGASQRPHRVPPFVWIGFLISLFFLIYLITTAKFYVGHAVSIICLIICSVPIIKQVHEGAMPEELSAVTSEIRLLKSNHNNDQVEVEHLQSKTRKLVSYVVSLERLIEGMYKESVHFFQSEYIFNLQSGHIPEEFSQKPPQLNFVYRPLLEDWAEANGFCA